MADLEPVVLVGCECTGEIREALRALGIPVISADLQDATDGSPFHVVGDMFEVYERYKASIRCVIANPPSTYLNQGGLQLNKRDPERREKTAAALAFVNRIFELPVPMLCVLNVVGCIASRIQKPSQYIQPYEFGDDAFRKMGLWLRGLPTLGATLYCPPRTTASGAKRWANQTDAGNIRSPCESPRTFAGIAIAMAIQWSPFIKSSS